MPSVRFGSIAIRAGGIVSGFALLSFGVSACGGGGGDPTPVQPNGKDSVSATVGPAGGTVTTPSGEAGVQVPAGTLGSNATITVTRLPTPSAPGQGPLPTSLNQYGPYYEVAISPANAQLGDSVRVGVCQVTDAGNQFYAPEATHSRLRLAHTVGSTTEILEPVGVSDFLRCTNVTANYDDPDASKFSRALSAFGRSAAQFFSPRSAYAAHGGLGGKVKSFSPFGAVDPLTGLSISPEAGLATGAPDDDVGGVAFDGTNYLVTLEPRDTQGQIALGAQLFSATGAIVGPRISLGVTTRFGSKVAFDGTNYLMVWSTGGAPSPVVGQFISKAGALVGSQFTVVPAGNANPSSIAFGGGTYYLAYVRPNVTNPSEFQFATYGRRISPAGVVGAQTTLSSANTGGDGFNNIAFDGANFLITYTDGATVKGRFVSSAGAGGQEVTIMPTSSFVNQIVSVAFNGTNYLVSASLGAPTVDAVSQLLSPAGARIGGAIGISTVAGADEFIVNATPTGDNFLVSYVDSFTVAGRATLKSRFVSGTGTTRGPAFTTASPVNGRIPLGWVVNFDGSRYMGLVMRGVPGVVDPQNTDTWTQKDVYSLVITATIPP